MTTSEREDIHKAIILHIQQGVGKDWVPALLMTDMAFSAYNAWKQYYPKLYWLWCVFHVHQAWVKKLKALQRPNSISQENFSRLKGAVFFEVLDLICPKDGVCPSESDFDLRAKRVLDALRKMGNPDIAASFESYVKQKDLWAFHHRKFIVETLFGSNTRFPMLARSNNPLERFFGVLKYILLKGLAALTISSFLDMWKIHQSRICINAVEGRH
jgi:hypothetical protein